MNIWCSGLCIHFQRKKQHQLSCAVTKLFQSAAWWQRIDKNYYTSFTLSLSIHIASLIVFFTYKTFYHPLNINGRDPSERGQTLSCHQNTCNGLAAPVLKTLSILRLIASKKEIVFANVCVNFKTSSTSSFAWLQVRVCMLATFDFTCSATWSVPNQRHADHAQRRCWAGTSLFLEKLPRASIPALAPFPSAATCCCYWSA